MTTEGPAVRSPMWLHANARIHGNPGRDVMQRHQPHFLRQAAPWLLGTVGLLAACATNQYGRRGDSVDVSDYPPEIQEAYAVFANRCNRCHSLARPLSANISDPQHWVRYVKRMSLQPGSGIGPHNSGDILRFLLFYTELQADKDSEGEADDESAAQSGDDATQADVTNDSSADVPTAAPEDSQDATNMTPPTTTAAPTTTTAPTPEATSPAADTATAPASTASAPERQP